MQYVISYGFPRLFQTMLETAASINTLDLVAMETPAFYANSITMWISITTYTDTPRVLRHL